MQAEAELIEIAAYSEMKAQPGPPMRPLPKSGSLFGAASIRSSPIALCRSHLRCSPRWVARYGAETTVPDWRERLVCSKCDSREIDMVVTGERRPAGRRQG